MTKIKKPELARLQDENEGLRNEVSELRDEIEELRNRVIETETDAQNLREVIAEYERTNLSSPFEKDDEDLTDEEYDCTIKDVNPSRKDNKLKE